MSISYIRSFRVNERPLRPETSKRGASVTKLI